jgi:hypothetical protein
MGCCPLIGDIKCKLLFGRSVGLLILVLRSAADSPPSEGICEAAVAVAVVAEADAVEVAMGTVAPYSVRV